MRLNAPIPGPAPYSLPHSHLSSSNGGNQTPTISSSSQSPQVMGPPPIRIQMGIYPQQQQPQNGQPYRSMIPPTLAPSAVPPEDRVQDAEQLQDALVSAGVDLKAEEFNLSQITTPTQHAPTILPPSYGGGLSVQQQLDEGKLIFNRATLSRFVDRIGNFLLFLT